jgi:hypothetical protein
METATRPLKREGFQTLIHARECLVFQANRRFETLTHDHRLGSKRIPEATRRSSRRSAPAIRTDLARRSLAAWSRSRERPGNCAGALGAAGVSPLEMMRLILRGASVSAASANAAVRRAHGIVVDTDGGSAHGPVAAPRTAKRVRARHRGTILAHKT